MNEDLSNINQEELDTLEMPQIESQYFIPMNLETLGDIKYDKKEFNEGIKQMSKVAGMFTALINSGLNSTDALSYILNKETIEHNLKSLEMTNENNIQIAKVSAVKIEGQQL